MSDCSVGDKLQALQRELAWQGIVIESFHATNDFPAVRRQVYDLMAQADIRIDVTALEKPKTEPAIAQSPWYFYKLASFLHFKYVIPRVATRSDDLMVVASALSMKKKKAVLHTAVRDDSGVADPSICHCVLAEPDRSVSTAGGLCGVGGTTQP
jgi:hypothetical protein